MLPDIRNVVAFPNFETAPQGKYQLDLFVVFQRGEDARCLSIRYSWHFLSHDSHTGDMVLSCTLELEGWIGDYFFD